MYRALILDMDDTLLKKDKTISPLTKNAIIKLQQRGIPVILASGRATYGMLLEAQELQLDHFNNYLISYNGAEIIQVNTMKVIYQYSLNQQDITNIQQFAHHHNVGIIAAKDQYIYIENYNTHASMEYTVNNMTVVKVDNILNVITTDIAKLILFDSTANMINIFHKAKQIFANKYSITRSNDNYVEFMSKNISKGTALQHLSQLINIPCNNMVACGDSFNDISLLKIVGMGIAMDNAVPELKSLANDITASNENDGIVKVIDKYFN